MSLGPMTRQPRSGALGAALAVLACLSPVTTRADDRQSCLRGARTPADVEACPPPDKPVEVMVLAKPPPRSASDWEVDAKTIRSAPHDSGADALNVVPGVFLGDRGLPGRAPHVSLALDGGGRPIQAHFRTPGLVRGVRIVAQP